MKSEYTHRILVYTRVGMDLCGMRWHQRNGWGVDTSGGNMDKNKWTATLTNESDVTQRAKFYCNCSSLSPQAMPQWTRESAFSCFISQFQHFFIGWAGKIRHLLECGKCLFKYKCIRGEVIQLSARTKQKTFFHFSSFHPPVDHGRRILLICKMCDQWLMHSYNKHSIAVWTLLGFFLLHYW